jgi:hypothetical protein
MAIEMDILADSSTVRGAAYGLPLVFWIALLAAWLT